MRPLLLLTAGSAYRTGRTKINDGSPGSLWRDSASKEEYLDCKRAGDEDVHHGSKDQKFPRKGRQEIVSNHEHAEALRAK